MLQNKKRKERQILGQSRFLGRRKKSRGRAACTYEKKKNNNNNNNGRRLLRRLSASGLPRLSLPRVLAPYKALFGEAPPERGTFVKLHAYEKAGIS